MTERIKKSPARGEMLHLTLQAERSTPYTRCISSRAGMSRCHESISRRG